MSEASPPLWLPPILSLSGDQQSDLAMLERIFINDFERGRPVFRGLSVGGTGDRFQERATVGRFGILFQS